MTLDAVEFIRRFLLHVLPSGLVRIRHFGFLATASALRTCNCSAICSLFAKLLRQLFPTTLPIKFKIARLVRLQARTVDHDRSHPPRTDYSSGDHPYR
jgi:hypothetical protein